MEIIGILVMTMLELDHFWIAQAIFLLCILSNIVSAIVKIRAYRYGF